MKIGVEVGVLRSTLTGIGWYVERVLDEWTRLASKDEFFLYASRAPRCGPAAANFRPRWESSPVPGTFWLQLRAAVLARRDGINGFWAPAQLLPLNLPRSVRTVLTVHDLVWLRYPETMARYNLFVHRMFFRRSVLRADRIITGSEFTRQELVKHIGVPAERIATIHHGVEDVFRPMPADETRTRLRGLGISGNFILAVGTVEPRKNYQLLFRALAALSEPLQLVVAGRLGWHYPEILAELDRLGLNSRVKCVAYVSTEDLVALYNGARLLVMPSVYEGFGLPILEAMACGTPVLASDSSSLPEVGGEAAAYFTNGSVDSLTDELSRLLESDATRQMMCERGLVRARQFTWEKTARATLAILRGTVDRE